METNETTDAKVGALSSIKTKVILLVICASVLVASVISIFIIIRSKSMLMQSYETVIRQTAVGYDAVLKNVLAQSGRTELTYDELKEIFAEFNVYGLDSANLSLTNKDNVFTYYSMDPDKVGTDGSSNLTLNGIVDDAQKGNYEKVTVVNYVNSEKINKVGCYVVNDISHDVLLVAVTVDEFMKPINDAIFLSVIIAVISVIIMVIIAFLIARSITDPVVKLSGIVNRTANLDFTTDIIMDKLVSRSDETGEMARATRQMQSNLRNVIDQLIDISKNMGKNADSLKSVTDKINFASTDNSATSEQLAASMEETSATIETIDSNTLNIRESAKQINSKALSGVDMSNSIKKRAENLHADALTSSNETENMYTKVKEQSYQALEQSKSVKKVNDLATIIQQIAEQTELLSLNASIEAARAGDMGKGFAVVATEIGTLASQSTQTADNIMSIIEEVNYAVNSMGECLEKMLDFLANKVMTDYKMFVDVSVKYQDDATDVHVSMNDIYDMINGLQKATEDISEAVSGINMTVSEAANGVSDVAQKTTEVVTLSAEVLEVVESTANNSKQLKKIAGDFKM